MAWPETVQTVTLTVGPLLEAGGTPRSGVKLTATLGRLVLIDDGGAALPSVTTVRTDESGTASMVLVATDSTGIDTTGWTYHLTCRGVLASAGINVALPAAVPTVAVETLAAQTAADGSTVWTPGAVYSVNGLTGAVELVTDHGALTGLADDDHAQYHTDARGDARYSQLGHGHAIADVTGLQGELDTLARGQVVCEGFARADVIAALDAAEALGQGAIVYFPAGVYDVGDGISLSGYSVQIRGAGVAGPTSSQAGTVFYASTQDGPVLDFSGYVSPTGFLGRVTHGGFCAMGSFAADATKNNAGLRFTSMSSARFADITIRGTGGPGIEAVETPGNGLYLCDFDRVTIETPISAKANDVPYIILNESNDCRWRSVGLRSLAASADVGVSGALVIEGNASYSPYGSQFDACWAENLHAPTNGTIISHAGNQNVFTDFVFHDCFKESGATDTAFVRLLPTSVANFGANVWRGMIPADGGGATEIDMGIVVGQSYNRIDGPRGYGATPCVQILSGVQRTAGLIAGSQSAVSGPAVQDDSGNATNALIDLTSGVMLGVVAAPSVTRRTPNTQTGAAYTPVLSDEGRLVMLTYAGAIDVTLPADSALAFPVGGRIDFGAFGVGGAITFVQGAGATVNGAPTLITEGRYHGATAFKTAADTWWVVGGLAAA